MVVEINNRELAITVVLDVMLALVLELEVGLEGLEVAVEGLEAEVEGLEAEVDGLEAEVEGLETEVEGLEAEVLVEGLEVGAELVLPVLGGDRLLAALKV